MTSVWTYALSRLNLVDQNLIYQDAEEQIIQDYLPDEIYSLAAISTGTAIFKIQH